MVLLVICAQSPIFRHTKCTSALMTSRAARNSPPSFSLVAILLPHSSMLPRCPVLFFSVAGYKRGRVSPATMQCRSRHTSMPTLQHHQERVTNSIPTCIILSYSRRKSCTFFSSALIVRVFCVWQAWQKVYEWLERCFVLAASKQRGSISQFLRIS